MSDGGVVETREQAISDALLRHFYDHRSEWDVLRADVLAQVADRAVSEWHATREAEGHAAVVAVMDEFKDRYISTFAAYSVAGPDGISRLSLEDALRIAGRGMVEGTPE